MKRDGECQDDITLELQQCFVMEQSSTFSSNSTSLLVYTCQFSPWYPVSLPDTNLCLSPAFINCSYLPSSSLSPSPVSITGLLWSSIAQEVEGPTGNGNGSDPRLCQSVLEQDIEMLLKSRLARCHAASPISVWKGEWGNVRCFESGLFVCHSLSLLSGPPGQRVVRIRYPGQLVMLRNTKRPTSAYSCCSQHSSTSHVPEHPAFQLFLTHFLFCFSARARVCVSKIQTIYNNRCFPKLLCFHHSLKIRFRALYWNL